jgi:hypothetical protein
MSRAPAPMTLEAATVPVNTNPYAMGTFAAAMPNTMMPQYPMGATASPMHAMQHMYTNMQQQPLQGPYGMQQPLVGQQQLPQNPYAMQPLVGQQPPLNPYAMQPLVGQQAPQGHPGMQNVSVLDFKPDVLAQQQAMQLHQQYTAHMNSMAAAAHPSLGVVGPDGRYMAATAATPGAMSPRFAPNPYDTVGTSAQQNGSWGSHGLHSHPISRSDDAYNMPRRNTMSSMHRHMDDARARNSSSMDTQSALKDMIDDRVNASRDRTNASVNHASSMATRAAMKDMIDQHVPSTRALKELIAERVPSARALNSLIEDHVERTVDRKVNQLALPQTAAAPVVASGFHSKPQEEQRRIVGDAVRSVMSNYHVTPKTMPNAELGSTSSSYANRERGPSVGSRFQRDGDY